MYSLASAMKRSASCSSTAPRALRRRSDIFFSSEMGLLVAQSAEWRGLCLASPSKRIGGHENAAFFIALVDYGPSSSICRSFRRDGALLVGDLGDRGLDQDLHDVG